jgi:putative tryptophan/tyrosine transport system substrate-binding protein
LKKVGFFGFGSPQADAGFLTGFRAGMLELGLVEGRDYAMETRHASGNLQAGPALAAELLGARPDVLLTPGDPAVKLLAQLTKTIPIVFGAAHDPVGNGLVASLRQPGGNVSGLSTMATELWPKRVQLLKEAFPRAEHIGVLLVPDFTASVSQVREIEAAAARIGVRVSPVEIRQPADMNPAFVRMASLRVKACAVPFDPLTLSQSRLVADHLIRLKLPSMSAGAAYAENGGLMSFAPSFTDNFRLAAGFVDKIFKGEKVGDLPVQQPTRFELIVNMKTAQALGIKLPGSLMLSVTRVIE